MSVSMRACTRVHINLHETHKKMVEKNNVTDTTGNLGTPDVIVSHTYAVIIG